MGKIVIHSYGLMLALSFLFGIWFSSWRAKKIGLDPNVISDIGFWVILSAIIGSRLYFVFLHFEDFKGNIASIINPFYGDACGIGGLVMYGGLIGAIAAGLIFFNVKKVNKFVVKIAFDDKPAKKAGIQAGDTLVSINGTLISDTKSLRKLLITTSPDKEVSLVVIRNGKAITLGLALTNIESHSAETPSQKENNIEIKNSDTGAVIIEKLGLSIDIIKEKLPFLSYADAMAPSLGFGIFLTRIGCFLNGCCYGKPAEAGFGVHFPIDSPAGKYQIAQHASELIPSQLYLSAGGLIIAIIVLLLARKKIFDGFQFYCTIVLYSILRFLVDFTRFYAEDERIATLSHNQIVCIVIFVIFAGLILKNFIFQKEISEEVESSIK